MRAEVEERQLRRLDRRIRYLEKLMRVVAIFGGQKRGRTRRRLRELYCRENKRLWDILYPQGEPEDLARVCGNNVENGGKKDGDHSGQNR